jgi:hypothetical protein
VHSRVIMNFDHLGINVSQRIDSEVPATRKKADWKELLIHEEAWVLTFVGLRDGAPECEWEIPGGHGSAMLIKSKQEDGRRRLQVLRSGKTANSIPSKTVDISLPRFATAPSDIRNWNERVEQEESEFDDFVTGKKAVKVKCPAKPAERHLFDALLRAKTAAQVRRICRRSELWLKYRWDLGKGHFFELWSACPRVLHERAEDFCQGKLDPRYPALDKRASGDYRRIEYLARVMAGSSLVKPIAPSYAVEVLRRMKHSRGCTCWRCALGIGSRHRRSLAQFLISSRR